MTFVRDYVQLRFNGPCLTALVWPVVHVAGVAHRVGTPGSRVSGRANCLLNAWGLRHPPEVWARWFDVPRAAVRRVHDKWDALRSVRPPPSR